jgi:hypothetical protein
MNKYLYKIALVIGLVSVVFGMLFKIQHWPFSYNMLTIGVILIGFIFTPIYSLTKYKKQPNNLLKATIGVGCTSAIVISLGTILNLSDSQFGYIIYRTGLFLLAGVFIPLLTYSTIQNKERRIKRILILAIVMSYVLSSFLLPSLIRLREHKEIINAFEIVNEAMESANSKINNRIDYGELLVNHADKRIIQKLKERSDSLCTFIGSLKLDLIESSTGSDSILDQILFKQNKARQLESLINSHRNFVEVNFTDKIEQESLSYYLSTKTSNPEVDNSWGEENFGKLPLQAIVTILTILESNIRNVESKIIESISKEVR